MCGRFQAFTREQIEEIVRDIAAGRLRAMGDDAPAQQMRPGMDVDVIGVCDGVRDGTQDSHRDGARDGARDGGLQALVCQQRSWGIKYPAGTSLMINARVESAESPVWREAFAKGRVIVPAKAYFEPHETETVIVKGRQRKRQYCFSPEDGLPLLMAGVTTQNGLAIVTTEAAPAIKDIHPRMPLLLRATDARNWLVGAWEEIESEPSMSLRAIPEFTVEEQLALF